MEPRPYLAELAPTLRLIVDELPPIGKKIYMVTKHGHGFLGDYHKEYQVVAWCGLPKFTPEQKRRLVGMEGAGIDPTIHPGVLYRAEDPNPPSCVAWQPSP